MATMTGFFASGHFVDLVLLFLVVEAIAVVGYWRRTRRGIRPAEFLPGLCSGALMLLALRVTLAGGGWLVPTLCLGAAGIAHLIDVSRRWRS
ncbi:hypothetical protein OO17_15705 [Rhodopseudomonas palustris]|uniref:Uncharacterized protein n=2 Tax=Nitrobacteraceae TaxID=41294 RepID=A0A0D7EKD0_RHOPL|nr:hypothetical protein OO17_15705 [Rhodopseudomonas palustris]